MKRRLYWMSGAQPRLHIDEGEELLEQLAHEERRAVVGAQRGQQPVQHRQDVAPVRAQLAGGCQRRACARCRGVKPGDCGSLKL